MYYCISSSSSIQGKSQLSNVRNSLNYWFQWEKLLWLPRSKSINLISRQGEVKKKQMRLAVSGLDRRPLKVT